MYDSNTISILEARIGYGSDSGIPIDVDASLKVGTTGRQFSYFHKLVLLSNIYETVEGISLDQAEFEAYLQQLISDSVIGSLVATLDQSVKYDVDFDYSQIIQDKPEVFDEVIGYNLAIASLEMMISSSRINDKQRNANYAYTKLKVELEGLVDNDGNVKSQGLTRKYNKAISKARKAIFPARIHVTSIKIW